MRWLCLLLLTACSRPPVPLEPPAISINCSSDGAVIRLKSETQVIEPILGIPHQHYPDINVIGKYQLKSFQSVSELFKIPHCPQFVDLEYRRTLEPGAPVYSQRYPGEP